MDPNKVLRLNKIHLLFLAVDVVIYIYKTIKKDNTMKTTRYRFEQAVQEVKTDTTEWLRDEFKSILEADKDFTRKADYIGFSIASIDDKVASIDEEIKELQQLKKNLKSAKDITLKTGAEVFQSYGIDKLEGAGISSITLSKETTKVSKTLEVLNKQALIDLGYSKVTVTLDEEAIKDALEDGTDELLNKYIQITVQETTTPAKLKINKRRAVTTNNKELLA